ncbi:MAG TPA: PQQ-dependent sugar dehydrogenase [Saprospiraceae bacterium]|nr:PQQ-dependent sugar dehydrogenase [Saprospiraceae bacterium]
MRTIHCILLLIAFVLITSCGNKITQSAPKVDNSNTGTEPVEKEAPNATYPPAFEGQTRIARIHTKTPYQVDILSKDLAKPWGIATLPDGRFLITEKKGNMRIASSDGTLGDAITGIPEVNSTGQGGLLGLCIDPDFAKNHMVYWVFSEGLPDGNLTAVAKGKLAADEKTIESATVIYRATPAYDGNLHYGGRILYKEGNLYISTGERSDLETRPLAQDLHTGLGKIIRITTDGKPAAGNPFTGNANASPAIYSYGHRNVQGIAFHPATGDLWEAEFGPRGGDELNLIVAGKNYGWPIITYGIEYGGEKIGEAIQQKPGLEQPVYYWDPVISPSGITFYSADAIPEWKNNLFIGCLSGLHICRLVIENNKVTGEERLLADQEQRFRDITQGKDGALYAITDSGWFYRISKK